jgi:hypothetical protein
VSGIDLEKLAEVLPPGERITEDEAVELMRRAGVRGDRTVLSGLLTSLATFGLVRRHGGPLRPDVERVTPEGPAARPAVEASVAMTEPGGSVLDVPQSRVDDYLERRRAERLGQLTDSQRQLVADLWAILPELRRVLDALRA